jgi:hypothetical protein
MLLMIYFTKINWNVLLCVLIVGDKGFAFFQLTSLWLTLNMSVLLYSAITYHVCL